MRTGYLVAIIILLSSGCSQDSNWPGWRSNLAAPPKCVTLATSAQNQIRKFVTTDPSQMGQVPQAGRLTEDVPDQTMGEYYLDLTFDTQTVSMIVDTGSSNVVLDPDSFTADSSRSLGRDFYISYASASGLVGEYSSNVNLDCSNSTQNYTIGVLKIPQDLQGILGLAYQSLAAPDDGSPRLPPLYDAIVQQSNGNVINMFAMALCGHKSGDEVIFGGPDPRISQSDLTYVPIVQKKWYVIDARSMQVLGWNKVGTAWVQSTNATASIGDFPALKPDGNGIPTIVDSGSTMNIFPTDIYQNAVAVLKAASNQQSLGIPDDFWTATPDDAHYSLTISPTVIAKLPTFQILVRGMTDQLVHLDLKPDTYLKVLDAVTGKRTASFRKSSSITILGQAFMEGYYIEFDRISTPNRIGFASNSSICTGP
jgi:hypothetical protein